MKVMEKMDNLIFLDGAMGTQLQKRGLKPGQRPEIFAIEHEDILVDIHKSYIEAGSDVIYANTFGANADKLADTGYSVFQVISENVRIAKKAAENRAKVALDVGPIGKLLEPLGDLSFEEAYDIYKEIMVAGNEAGADLIVCETMTDLYEVKAAVLAAKENTDLPVWVTMSFEENGRTFTGTTIESMAMTLEGLGVEAMGINCSLGPDDILPLIKTMREWTDCPIIAKPNAGLPDAATGEYDLKAGDFASAMIILVEAGAVIVGGCCGSEPEYIAQLKKVLSESDIEAAPKGKKRRGVCSPARVAEFVGINTIGERINPTGKKSFKEALHNHDMDFVMQKAIEQTEGGADILDVNVGLPGIDEVSMMIDVVKAVQSVTDLPLQIDSSNPDAIEAGLRVCNGRAIVNSVSAEPDSVKQILPIVKKYGAAVIGLALDKDGIPETAEGRFKLAGYILDEARNYGIPKEDIIIDCLTLTVSAQQNQALETLNAIRMVRNELGLHNVLGVSNISFGLPKRSNITKAFLSMAIENGLDFAIVNPNQQDVMDTIASCDAIMGYDKNCEKYIERFTEEAESVPKESAGAEMTVEEAVLKGLGGETGRLTLKLLENKDELEVINDYLIPALDVVGEKYEKGTFFLPQLVKAANAAGEGFEIIKKRIAQKGGERVSKGKILIATVEGDIHDIGKNIVKIVLENYGYDVVDMGTDVPPADIVSRVMDENIKLVGLSALMTTTVSSMKKTIEELESAGAGCKVFVGGAVLTPEYASEIGADYYAKDAKASVDIAKEIFG